MLQQRTCVQVSPVQIETLRIAKSSIKKLLEDDDRISSKEIFVRKIEFRGLMEGNFDNMMRYSGCRK